MFYSLLVLIGLVAIPYGTAQPWWQAVFQCLIFAFACIAVIERWLRADESVRLAGILNSIQRGGGKLLLPLLVLIIFALVQVIPWRGNVGGVNVQWTLSWDPPGTKAFIVQLCALIAFGWLLVRYTVTERRLLFLVDTIIVIALFSAVFGLWRQATQQQTGFILPELKAGYGYAQFINSNHFAFLMEMALGLILGIVVTRGVSGRRLILFLIAALVMWVAVVRVNSRGGLLSMLSQVVLLGVLLVSNRNPVTGEKRAASKIQRWAVSASLIFVLLAGSVITVMFIGGDPLAGRIDSLSVELNSKTAQTYTLRQNIWQATWALIKDHPIKGVGFGGYWIAISEYHKSSGETAPQQAHSDYLELMASGGVIAVAIGLWFVIAFASLARSAFTNANRLQRGVAAGAIVGILTVSIHSFVDFGLHLPINALVCTTLVAFVVIVEKHNRHRQTESAGPA